MFDGAIRRSPTTSGSEPTASVSYDNSARRHEDDVRFYIDVDELVGLVDELVLPPREAGLADGSYGSEGCSCVLSPLQSG